MPPKVTAGARQAKNRNSVELMRGKRGARVHVKQHERTPLAARERQWHHGDGRHRISVSTAGSTDCDWRLPRKRGFQHLRELFLIRLV